MHYKISHSKSTTYFSLTIALMLSFVWFGCSENKSNQTSLADEQGEENEINKPEVIASDQITYYQDVRPILETHCTGCHRKDGVGLFELTTYESAKMWSTAIVEATQAKTKAYIPEQQDAWSWLVMTLA